MAVTLADFRTLVGDDISWNVINTLREEHPVLDRVQFEFANAQAGGGAMAYVYKTVDKQATAGVRALGANYTAQEATAKNTTVDLKILGGQFAIDRALGLAMGPEITFQVSQKTRAVGNEFQRLFINGDSATTASEYDGIAKYAVGEQAIADAVDLVGATDQASAIAVARSMDAMLSRLLGESGVVILVNRQTKALLHTVGRLVGNIELRTDAFGKPYPTYAGLPILDMGVDNAGNEVIPVATGVTSIYAVRMDAMEGVHALAPAGSAPVRTFMPDPNTANGEAVLKGTVEMVTALAVKHPRAVAALTNVKVA